eukprot:CAMPEP_0176248658 /NCGR_PEP_ID=MMETSP0121_2-20121125/33578_1 /TAXON_ID=160619 /ORGANISM="Kryptoperidinium foliaceum, Strain CCMP 1326" /LENGTH=212 /DNA_ID=CAMNT_0017588339 /DNA_START=106 /DNA_END=744 /DNA_ORIENTATION=-
MMTLWGQAQAFATAPWCEARDLAALSSAHRTINTVLSADPIWWHLLVEHFAPVFQLLRSTEEGLDASRMSLPTSFVGSPREVYLALAATSSEPFVLGGRARLLLEIHELREWDRHHRLLVLRRQAALLARALGREDAAERLAEEAKPSALELLALQAMMAGGGARQLAEQAGMEWGEPLELECRKLTEKRLTRRRAFWHKQREYLLQELEWN